MQTYGKRRKTQEVQAVRVREPSFAANDGAQDWPSVHVTATVIPSGNVPDSHSSGARSTGILATEPPVAGAGETPQKKGKFSVAENNAIMQALDEQLRENELGYDAIKVLRSRKKDPRTRKIWAALAAAVRGSWHVD